MDKTNPLVSIIIPNFNRADLLPETLNSISIQTYQNWECIVVDDGSTDNSSEVIRKIAAEDTRFKLFKRPKEYKPGANGARNFGFDVSNGDFIQWFDSDDLMHKDLLSDKINLFNQNTDLQTIISRLSFFNGNKAYIRESHLKMDSNIIYENIISWKIPVWTNSIMFRKHFLTNCSERFDETILRLQDYDFYSRLFINYQPKTKLLDKALCFVRRDNKDAKTTAYFSADRIIDLENSEFIVAKKIITLLTEKDRFSKYLEDYFYKDHKKRISKLIKFRDNDLANSFKRQVEFFLTFNNNKVRLTRFKLGYFLLKKFPFMKNVFLVYKKPEIVQFAHKSSVRFYKIFTQKGYFTTNFKKAFIN